MNENTYTKGLDYDLIRRAVSGEESALEEILRIYDLFINSLVSQDITGQDGRIHKEMNEDWKVQIQMRIVDAIKTKWRELI